MMRTKVRCLGPGKEHWFMSSNRCKHRICPKCAEKNKRQLSNIYYEPVVVANNNKDY